MITPAIIPKSLNDLETSLKLVNFSESVQIDVVDGKFVKSISWPYSPAGEVSEVKDLIKPYEVEVDLMVADSIKAAREWLLSGAKKIVFHLETLDSLNDAILLRKEFDFELGLAVSNETPLDKLYEHIENVDYVQLMGIKVIGSQGQPFDVSVLERIATLRYLYPNLKISIDGAVNEDNILSLKQAGANSFAVGSNILSASKPKEQYEKLLKIVQG